MRPCRWHITGVRQTLALAGLSTEPDHGWASPASPPVPLPTPGPHCTLSPSLLGPLWSAAVCRTSLALRELGHSGQFSSHVCSDAPTLGLSGVSGTRRVTEVRHPCHQSGAESTRLAWGLDHLVKVCFQVSPPAGSLSPGSRSLGPVRAPGKGGLRSSPGGHLPALLGIPQ